MIDWIRPRLHLPERPAPRPLPLDQPTTLVAPTPFPRGLVTSLKA